MSRQHLTDATRAALIDAAVHEFAAHGFEGGSTRAIAARAGVHQPQINYHFSSKLALWRAAVDHLFAELRQEQERFQRPDLDEVQSLAAGIRAFVHHAARRPELNRIMVRESGVMGERLDWMIETHVRARFATMASNWERLRADGRVVDVDALTAFYMILGGGTLLYTNAPEAQAISGLDPFEPDRIDAHAEALISMLILTPRSAA